MLLCLLYGTDVDVPMHMLLYSYFFFNSGMENRILSQICGRLYFPIFLFRVGLLTLMYIDFWWSWPGYFLLLLWSWNCSMLLHGHCCFGAGILVKELSNVPCIFLQKFFQIPLYTLHHSQSLHMYNCISHCSYLWCYPYLWVKPICSSKFDLP